MTRFCVFDTETTGLGHNDAIIELGVVEIVNWRITGGGVQRFRPHCTVSDGARSVHGIGDEDLQHEPAFADVADQILNYFGDSTLVAHNAKFDIGMMNNELRRCGKSPLRNVAIDTLPLARRKFPGQKNNLDALMRRFNLASDDRKTHGAYEDAIFAANVFLHLIHGVNMDALQYPIIIDPTGQRPFNALMQPAFLGEH
ncbi:hypothetical protein A4U49_15425 [Acidithiobacillus ferrivorans]|uniref:exonuclease domain-containing protein n=1 Tax=Acidithiobacillus ferrivorans TaxID=160808 RepID=UPI0008930DE1|nr:exonuclease domain-containing protein [Acidithiobacillus ferrivorans]OFA14967.1 hypothetical protein A4U49_15425 [Acidithiobacillus ferrivorans]